MLLCMLGWYASVVTAMVELVTKNDVICYIAIKVMVYLRFLFSGGPLL